MAIATATFLSCAAFSPMLINDIPSNKLNVATTTTYDYKWWSINTIRNRLDTTRKSKEVSHSGYTTVSTFSNKTNTSASHEFTDECTESSSVSCGGKVTVKAIEVEAGKDVKYSRTKTFKTSVNVPKKTTYRLKVRTQTEKFKYSSKVQRQDNYTYFSFSKGFYTKWKDIGASSTASSTQTHKSPEWVLQ